MINVIRHEQYLYEHIKIKAKREVSQDFLEEYLLQTDSKYLMVDSSRTPQMMLEVSQISSHRRSLGTARIRAFHIVFYGQDVIKARRKALL